MNLGSIKIMRNLKKIIHIEKDNDGYQMSHGSELIRILTASAYYTLQ
jgi:hypothetical protein